MPTTLGKILVLLTVALSWGLTILVFGAYTQAIDFGWKEPRKDLEKKPIPSELKKRQQEIELAVAAAPRLQAALQTARRNLHEAQLQFPINHLWYNEQLALLLRSPNPIKVDEIKLDAKGKMALMPASPIGRPVLEGVVPGLNKSEQGLWAEYQDLQSQIDVQVATLQKLDQERKAITLRMSPVKDGEGKVLRKGLDDLVDVEALHQQKLREEIDRIRPLWTRELANAQLLLDRRMILQRRLDELKAKKVALAP
jgi:hypothetical protein